MPDAALGPVVCNTGPLLALARASLLDLPSHLFSRVVIPQEVWDELMQPGFPDAAELRQKLASCEILTAPAVADPLLVAEFDRGEAAVIATARALAIDAVLMDEPKGRRFAEMVYRLRVRGTCGLLVSAKKRGLLATVRPALEAMRSQGYFISDALAEECLRRAGEL